MKLFLDTAILEDIKPWIATGLVDGITTNPTLLSHAGTNPLQLIKEIQKIVPNGLISVEVTQSEPHDVYEQAHAIARLGSSILVKIPCSFSYYEIIKKLVSEGIRLNITLVFSLMQGVFMGKLGVEYISPFLGRLDDAGADSSALLYQLCAAKKIYHFSTKILAASIRNQEHIKKAIEYGVDAITVSPVLCQELTHHELTEKGIQKFMNDWKTLNIARFP